MVSAMFLFSVCGLAINGYLFYRWCSMSKNLNKIVLFQLILNICNIIAHAAVEEFKHPAWIFLATSFSFQTIYFFVTIEVASALRRPLQRSLNSSLNTALLSFVFTGLSTVFGRTANDVCGANNCFYYSSKQGLSPEEENAVIRSCIVHFFVPTSIILFTRCYIGLGKWERIKSMDPTSSCLSRVFCLLTDSPVALFLLYGTVVFEVMLFSTEVDQTIQPRARICEVNCLNEELYLLLSMFPIGILVDTVKDNEGRQQELPWEIRKAYNHKDNRYLNWYVM